MMLKRVSISLAVAAAILSTAAILRYSRELQLIDADTTRRAMQMIIGLILAAYANVMPKDIGTSPVSARAATRSQSARRVGGWSLTLAGLGYAGLWAFTPIAFADVASMVLVATATAVTVAYGAWALVICRRTESPFSGG